MKNFFKLKEILNTTKNNSALTLVEILVSLVVMTLVVMYSMIFFSSAFRLSLESKEYTQILQNVVNNLEEAVAQKYGTTLNNSSYIIKTETLRGKYTVTYELEFSNIILPKDVNNLVYARYITSKAYWQYKEGAIDWHQVNQLSVKTVVSFSNSVSANVAGVSSVYGRWR